MRRNFLQEEAEEQYRQDIIDLEADKEKEVFNVYIGKPLKNIYSHKLHFKNRRNHHRFAKRNTAYGVKLPF